MVNKSDRTVRQWRTNLVENDGVLPESKQGKYQRTGVPWYNENLNKNLSRKCPIDFCKWVNKNLLPNCTLEPGYLGKISWHIHQLGFEIMTPHKGIFIDSHEHDDIAAYRKIFLRKWWRLAFFISPTESTQKAIPTDVGPPTLVSDQNVFFFHDESIFSTNEDQNKNWGTKGQKMIKPKSKGSGIILWSAICVKTLLHGLLNKAWFNNVMIY